MHQTYISSCRLFVYSVYLKKIPFCNSHYSFTPTHPFFPKYWKTLFSSLLFFCKVGNRMITFPSLKFRVVLSKGVGNFNSVFIKWREKYFHSIYEKGKCLRKGFCFTYNFRTFNSIHLFLFSKKIVFLYIHVKFNPH